MCNVKIVAISKHMLLYFGKADKIKRKILKRKGGGKEKENKRQKGWIKILNFHLTTVVPYLFSSESYVLSTANCPRFQFLKF